MAARKHNHAILAARDEQRFEIHLTGNLLTSRQQPLPVVADTNAERRFYFRLIRRRRGDPDELQHAMARVEHDRHFVDPTLFTNQIQQCGGRRTVPVVGNQHRVRGPAVFSRGQNQFTPKMRVWALAGLPVHTHHLLPGSVRKSSENARLGHSGVTLVLQHATHRNAFVAEGAEQQPARLVISYDADRQNGYAEVGKVIDGIGAAAGHDFAVAMSQYQHGRLARDAGNLAEDIFVGNEVGEHGYRDLGE